MQSKITFFFFFTFCFMSFPKTCFRWKSEHSTAVSSQNENESKAQQEKKRKLDGCFTFLLHHINHVLIHSLDYISLTHCFVRLLFFFFFCISISFGAIFPSSPTAWNVLEKVDWCSASQTVGWKFFRMFDCTTQRHKWLPNPYPYNKPLFPANGSTQSLFARGFQNQLNC